MDNLPWGVITAASGGWILFGWLAQMVLRKLMSGDLVTRREADAKDDENVRLRGKNDHLQEQLGESLKALTTMNDSLSGLRAAAEERS